MRSFSRGHLSRSACRHVKHRAKRSGRIQTAASSQSPSGAVGAEALTMTSPRKSRDPKTLRPATQLIHGGSLRSSFEETSEALFLTQGYLYDTMELAEARFKGDDPGFIYSRFANPTVSMFEKRMALLEGAEAARATASGMAAVTAAMMGQLKAGDHIVAARALFGSCLYVVEDLLPRFGVASTLVDGANLDEWRAALRPNTKTAFLEVADQSDARTRRHRRRRRDHAWRRRDARGRQRVRHAPASASVEARRRLRRLLGDQAHRRPGPRAGRCHPGKREIHRRPYPQFPAPDRPCALAVQRLDAAQVAGDPARSRRRPDAKRGRSRISSASIRRSSARSIRAAPIIRRRRSPSARWKAAARSWRSRSPAARRRRSRSPTLSPSSAFPTISATRKALSPIRRRRPTSGSSPSSGRRSASRPACSTVGRPRGRRRSDRGSGPGARQGVGAAPARRGVGCGLYRHFYRRGLMISGTSDPVSFRGFAEGRPASRIGSFRPFQIRFPA